MPVDRPTFSESWYRVAQLRPRLRSTVQIHRQHYRGRMWYVLQDPSNNQYYRQNEAAYHFVAMLDGRRTIGDVWRACNEELGDAAPTQGEAIQLLGQLYTSNLIQCELPPDAEGLFSRFQKRRHREVKGYLSNLMFIRIPLFDPDPFLDRWVKLFGKFFSAWGLMLWTLVVGFGLFHVVSNFDKLSDAANNVLDPEGLPLLYVSFVMIKVVHEFGHAFACKKFGQLGGGGEVHTMGVMFLVFTPLPYVDASSSWAFRSKWHRVVVGGGGILVELFFAAIAAIVWANTSHPVVTTIAYNVMFIASVSTLLFNANPLLRYDGYYILSDLIEIPNLSQRAKQYLQYLVKKYAWRVRNPRNPAHTGWEKGWFVFYGIASTVYRFFICFRILMFVADKLFFVGFALAVAAAVAWVCVPIGKLIHYLATSGELNRVRGRAVWTSTATVGLILLAIGAIPAPERYRCEGVAEPEMMIGVYAGTEGRVVAYAPNRSEVDVGDVLLEMENPELKAKLVELLAARQANVVAKRAAEAAGELAEAAKLTSKIVSDEENIAKVREDLEALTVRAKVAGLFVSPRIDQLEGAYLSRGDRVGHVAQPSKLEIRAVVGQNQALALREFVSSDENETLYAEMRVKGRPKDFLTGRATLDDFVPAGSGQLPSPALSYQAGGSVATDPTDQKGVKAMEKYVEVRVTPDNGGLLMGGQSCDVASDEHCLLPGQRVVIRIDMPKRPLLFQWIHKGRQLIQRRFNI